MPTNGRDANISLSINVITRDTICNPMAYCSVWCMFNDSGSFAYS